MPKCLLSTTKLFCSYVSEDEGVKIIVEMNGKTLSHSKCII